MQTCQPSGALLIRLSQMFFIRPASTGELQSYLNGQVSSKRPRMPTSAMSSIMRELQFSREETFFANLSSILNCNIASPALTELYSRRRYSYEASLNPVERLHYSRLCYLFPDEKTISRKSRNDIVDTLLTNTEKEEFFDQYEMADKLLDLYLNLGEYERALDLLEKKGDPDAAWQVIIERAGKFSPMRQPLDREVRFYNYARAREFLAILGTFPKVAFSSNDRGPGVPGHWPDGNFWDGLVPTVHKLFMHQISYSSVTLAEKWMKQFLNITVGGPRASFCQLN